MLVFCLFHTHGHGQNIHSFSLPFCTHSFFLTAVLGLYSFFFFTFLFSSAHLWVLDPFRPFHVRWKPAIKLTSLVPLCVMLPAWGGAPVGMPDPSLFPPRSRPHQGAFGQSFHIGEYCTAPVGVNPHHTGYPASDSAPGLHPEYCLTTHDRHMMWEWPWLRF